MGLKITGAPQQAGKPTRTQRISLCMIMKDEEEHLPRCLAAVQGVVDEIIIVDTGSTDSSVAIAESFGAKVIHEPWINDFAYHRNTGLDAATGDWILMLDADEELVDGKALHPLLDDPDMDGYSLREVNFIGAEVGAESVVNSAFRLFRNRPHHRYAGALHEQIYAAVDPTASRSKFVDVEILHYGYLDGTAEAKRKKERNMRIALAEVKRKPNDSFILFNAGVEFQRVGDAETAVEYFARSFQNIDSMRMNFVSLLLRNMAASLVDTKRFDEALEIVANAIEAYPQYTDLYFVEGHAYWSQREYRKAIESFGRAVEMGDHRGELYMSQQGMGTFASWNAMGVVYENMGDIGQAVACYRRSLASSKALFPPPLRRLAKLAAECETPEGAEAFIRTLLPSSSRAEALRVVGDTFTVEGLGEQALAMFDEALELEPTLHAVRVSKAHCLVLLKRYDDAVATVAEIPTTSSVHAMGISKLAMTALASGDLEMLRDAIDRMAPVVDSNLVETWRVCLSARAGIEHQLASDVSVAEVTSLLLTLASTMLQLNQLDAFNAIVPALLAVAPDRPQIDEALGLMFDDAGFKTQAAQCLTDAAHGGRELSTQSLVALARHCAENDLAEDAENFYRAAIAQDPEGQSHYVGLATLMASERRYADAAAVLVDGMEVWPRSTVLRELHESMEIMAGAGQPVA